MNKRPWTIDEENFLKMNVRKLGLSNCAEVLGRTVSSTSHKSQNLGIEDSRWWTLEEIAYLKENFETISQKEIAEHLGRTENGVNHKIKKMGMAQSNFYPVDRFCADCGKKLSNKYLPYERCSTCRGLNCKGENNPQWQGGISSLRKYIASRIRPWMKTILKRDGYECQVCGSFKDLEVHHIRPLASIRDFVMSLYPELSIEIVFHKLQLAELIAKEHTMEDGITLCDECHIEIHSETRDELLENPTANKGEGNQQPSQPNVVSIVSWKAQRLTVEDTTANKTDTSVPISGSLPEILYSPSCIEICRSRI